MKHFYRLLYFLTLMVSALTSSAQTGVLNPNDPIVIYNPSSPPAQPPYNTLAKWVKTTRLNWSTDSYKCYIYNGMAFRLKFPKSYQPGVNDGKVYPLLIFFHGLGEAGTIYDNEYQLYHGGQLYQSMVDNGTYDGFLLYPQNTSGYFGNSQYDALYTIVNNYMIPECKVDPFRITVDGLSAGGAATWEMMFRYPKFIAGAAPISAASLSFRDNLSVWKYTPLWLFQGGKDMNPDPGIAQDIYTAAQAAGANMKLTVYPDLGHGVWYNAWGEPDYFPFLNRAHKANPWPLFGRTEFCPSDPINVTLGLTAGFDQYEWRKDGTIIPGATSNTLTVTTTGTYDAHVKNGNTWSPWSPIPVVIKIKAPTVPPPITVSGLQSKVIPTPAGVNSVTLSVPNTYATYSWKNVNDTTVLGTQNSLVVTSPGSYTVKVTEQYGCSSDYSTPFTVINANGANGPGAPAGLAAQATSKTQVQLNWTVNPSATNPETNFEVYRGTAAGGPYTLVAILPAGTTTYTDGSLNAGTRYYYVVRAVNNNAGSPKSNEANAITQADTTPPTAPPNLRITGNGGNQISLAWDPATDDVGVDKYDIYINGVKSYSVAGNVTAFTAYNLTKGNQYYFQVKARDLAGNQSPFSNQASALAYLTGLRYKTYSGSWSALPDFNTLTPVAQGVVPQVDLSIRPADVNFAIKWEGFIYIPVAGSYTFETYSDDGSRLYIDQTTYSAGLTPLVDNDGLHAAQYRQGTVTLTKGIHPIIITYFQAGGGFDMKLYWKNTANGVGSTRQEIPASFFTENPNATSPALPAQPSGITATALSYNKIRVNWTDNSNNETGFEVYRSVAPNGPYQIVATTGPGATVYLDSPLVPQTTYAYRVQAINNAGNSGFISVEDDGLAYQYYELGSNTPSTMPDFSTLTPTATGQVPNVTLNVRNVDYNFAIKFSGQIRIPTTGTYNFYTTSDDGSQLFINGTMVVNNNYTQAPTERSGSITLNAGTYPYTVTYFQAGGGMALETRWDGPGIVKSLIPDSVFINPAKRATTLALPAIPATPASLTATAASSSKIQLNWTNPTADAKAFDIYRSINDNLHYVLQNTITVSGTPVSSYLDSSLFSNVTYFYKITAKNEGGVSGYSNEASVATLNNPPSINNVSSFAMHYGTTQTVNYQAASPDGQALTLTATNLPTFASFVDNGNGSGTLTLNPASTDQAVYPNITVTAKDPHNGTAAASFTLTVNDSYPPVLAAINNTTTAAGAPVTISLSATDANAADVITWSATGLPAFATLTGNNRTAQIQVTPGYADAGTYAISVLVNNGKGGMDTKNFNLVVTPGTPNSRILVNFNDGSATSVGPLPWNNTGKPPVQNDVFANLKDTSGNVTPISITVMTPWQNQNNGTNLLGAVTGNNSGIFPDNVMRSAYWTAGDKQTLKVSGLNKSGNYKYKFTFFGSRGDVYDTRATNYTINGTTVTLSAVNNTTNTVNIAGLLPDTSGSVTIDITKATGSDYGYLNALVIDVQYDDHTVPAKPKNIAAAEAGNTVKVTWLPVAYNDNGYRVYRATTAAGPYTQLSPVTAQGASSFTDATVTGSADYYYYVIAFNSYGNSLSSDTVHIRTTSKPPVITGLANQSLKTGDVKAVNFTYATDPGTTVTLSGVNLPPFATITDNGNGTAVLNMTPGAANVGNYNVGVKASASNGTSTTSSFTITVTDKNITSVYINFNDINPAPAPWNNFNGTPFAGKVVSSLVNDAGVTTAMSITQVDNIDGSNSFGATTGNNSGIYPDVVMQTFYFDGSGTPKRFRLNGLDVTKKYNLVFFGSRGSVTDNRTTDYAVGSTIVSLNAASNTQNTVQINALSPDASGQIEFTFNKNVNAVFGYLNALVVQSYTDSGIPVAPTNLKASSKSKTSIGLTWTTNAASPTSNEIWRSTSSTGTYTLVATVAGNVNSYVNTGLTQNTKYYYKVRTIKSGTPSNYSNIADAATFAYTVMLNLNRDNPAAAPWNNTNRVPQLGDVYQNLNNDEGNNSGISMTLTQNFSGDNTLGMNTGNNSGVYPDNVIVSNWWVDAGTVGKIKFSGLNMAQAYTFVFFGSRNGDGDRTTAYTINGRSVTLNASFNVNNTVQLDDVRPDANGEVEISVSVGSQYAPYGYIASVVLSGYAPKDASGNGTLMKTGDNFINPAVTTNDASQLKQDLNKESLTVDNIYPNPFRSNLNLVITRNGKPVKVGLTMFDMSGRMVAGQQLGDLAAGRHQLSFTPGASLPAGIYVLQVTANNRVVQTIRLIKQ